MRDRKPRGLPDVLFGLGATAWGMALVLVIALLLGSDVLVGDAGVAIARIFAGALAVAGLCLTLLAISLLGDDRNRADHYIVPICVGLIVGAAEALLVIQSAGAAAFLPLPFLVFTLRPVRAFMARAAGGRR